MKVRKLLVFLSLFVCFGGYSWGQAGMVCPPNIDFELGDLSVWTYFTGSCCTAGVPVVATPSAAVPCRHTLTTATGLVGCTVTPYVGPASLDEYGGFPVLSPGGGNYSIKLGNKTTGGQSERATYNVHVPVGISNYSLIYRYAVVFQDPSHSVDIQPRFLVKAYDSATLTPIPCAEFNYVSSASLPGFTLSSCTTCSPGGTVYYKGWTTAAIDLSGSGGTTVGIDFISADCGAGGHFGYGYLDLSCGLFQVSSNTCDTLTPPTLSAPFGFAAYNWYDSATFSIFYGSGSSITIPFPPGPVTLAVILTPYPGFGCADTLYSRVVPAHMSLNVMNDTTICRGRSLMLNTGATDIAVPLSYSWTPALGLSCTTCANPVASPSVSTTYSVTITNTAGCVKDTFITVGVLPDVNTTIDFDTPTCSGYTDASAWVTPTSGTGPYTYVWSTTPTQTTSLATGISSGTYTVVVTDVLGCTDTNTVVIANPAPRTINVFTSTNPTTCLGFNGTITLGGMLIPDTVYTISYLKDGLAQTQVLTANSSGQVTLTGLYAGTYSNITVILALCTYNIIGPVVLSDPPNPDLSGVTSNSFVCVGDTLNLFATSTTPGVLWSWEGPGGYSSGWQNPVIFPVTLANEGVYSVTVVWNNCYNYGSTLVDIRPLPVPVATSNTPVCSGDTLHLSSFSSSGATSYSWTGPDFFSSIIQNPYIVHVQTVSTGTYTVAITLDGCTVPTTVTVTVNQTPSAPVVSDTNYCQNDFAVPIPAGGTNLLWYSTPTGGVGSPVAPVPSTGKSDNIVWYVSQTSAEGCTSVRSKVSTRIWNYPQLNFALTDSVSCAGKYITFTAENVQEGGQGFAWHFEPGDSILNVNPVYHAFNSTGVFTVAVTAYYKYCPDTTMSRIVSVFPYPTIDLGRDTSICAGSEPIELKGIINTYGATARWSWSTGATTPKITVGSPGTYRASITANGCTSSDSVIVANDCYIDVPNVFTPNGDGINDYFFPRSLLSSGLTRFSMGIYNRWGQLVFESTTLEGRGWDGTLNGVPQPQGVYIYVIDAEFKDGQKEKHQGNITMLK